MMTMAYGARWQSLLLAIAVAGIACSAFAGTLGSDNVGQLSLLEIENALQVRIRSYHWQMNRAE